MVVYCQLYVLQMNLVVAGWNFDYVVMFWYLSIQIQVEQLYSLGYKSPLSTFQQVRYYFHCFHRPLRNYLKRGLHARHAVSHLFFVLVSISRSHFSRFVALSEKYQNNIRSIEHNLMCFLDKFLIKNGRNITTTRFLHQSPIFTLFFKNTFYKKHEPQNSQKLRRS